MPSEETTPDLQSDPIGGVEEGAGEEYGQERQAAERVIGEKSVIMPPDWKEVIYPPSQSQETKPVAGEKPKNLAESGQEA